MFLMELGTKSKKYAAMSVIMEDSMKIKFNSDHDLPLKKPLKFHLTLPGLGVFDNL